MTNTQRGEHQLDIGDVKLTLKPTYENFAKIESLLNMSIMEICYKSGDGSLKVSELVPLIEIFSGEKNLGEKIVAAGYTSLLPGIGVFLVKAISADAPSGGKAGGE